MVTSHRPAIGDLTNFSGLPSLTSSAFLISNGSFYLLSGRAPNASWAQYLDGVATYYPPYLSATLMYGVVIFGLVSVVKALFTAKASREAV